MMRPEFLEQASGFRMDYVACSGYRGARHLGLPPLWNYAFARVCEQKKGVRHCSGQSSSRRSIADLVENYLSEVENNAVVISNVLEECAPKMPEYYPRLGRRILRTASFDWIYSEWVKKSVSLQPLAKKVNDAVRAYFDTDNLLPPVVKVKGRWPWLLLRRT